MRQASSPHIVTHYDVNLTRTRRNPLKGFYTDYSWHYHGPNDFPASLEFAYLPLSALMDGPSSFTFDTGLEPRLQAAAARFQQLIIRVFIDYPHKPSGLPGFLKGKVHMNNYTEHGGGQSPDYNDPDLRKAILSFIEALGRRYDGDRRLGIVQLGLLGYWGEWHTSPHTNWFPDTQFQDEVLKAYDTAFQTTLLQVRYPTKESMKYRVGFHDDSFAQDTIGSRGWFFHNRFLKLGAGDRWKNVSIGGELRPELQNEIFEDSYTTGDFRQNFAQCANTTHLSNLLYGGAFNNRAHDSAKERQNAEDAALSMGYAYHVPRTVLNGSTLHVDIQNIGVAPFYPRVYLQVSDSAQVSSFVQVMLPRLTPDMGTMTFDLDVISLSPPSVSSPWRLSLESDYILLQQDVLLATQPSDDVIRIACPKSSSVC